MKDPAIKRTSTVFLQAVIVLIGIGVLAFLLWEPQVEGRNINATQFEIYFNDPFLVYVYVSSIAFFTALYQAFTLLRHIGKNKVFSPDSVKAVGTIKYCAVTIVALTALPEAYLFIVRPEDDIAGGVAMGLFVILMSIVIATAAAVSERLLQSAVDMKAENDLTV